MMTPRIALLALLALLCVALFARAMPTDTDDEVVSQRLQELLLRDKAFIDAERVAEQQQGHKLQAIKGNTAYNYAVATKLFWHSVRSCAASTTSAQTRHSHSAARSFWGMDWTWMFQL